MLRKPAEYRFHAWQGPFVGVVVGVYLSQNAEIFGLKPSLVGTLCSATAGGIAGSLIWLMDRIEYGGSRESRPNALVTIVVLVLGVVLFWVPVLGFVTLSYSLYRSRWLEVHDWVMFPVALIWFVSAAVTIVTVITFIMEAR